MSSVYWLGHADPVTYTVRYTPTVTSGDTFTIKLGSSGVGVSYTAAASTAADVVDGLYALLIADGCPSALQHNNEISWTKGGGSAYLEAAVVTAGEWFNLTLAATGGSSWATATQIAAGGPKVLSDPKNWSGGAVPGAGDDVYFLNTDAEIKYDLEAFAATTFSTLIIEGFTGSIGLPYRNAGSFKYAEYRPRFLKCGMTTARVGLINGLSPLYNFVKLDASNIQTTLYLQGASSASEAGSAGVEWKGTHASNAIYVYRGSLDIAPRRGDVATVANLYVGATDFRGGDALVNVGHGVTLTNLYSYAGQVGLHAAPTNTYLYGGRLLRLDGGGFGTIQTTPVNASLTVGSGGSA